MIDAYHHITLNGVKYRLAEDAEGNHYIMSADPLRPPNAVVVQGESQQKFQVRPDVLQWSLTDWSGGEGQEKFDAQLPNRWRRLVAVDPFKEPGRLHAGMYVEDTQDSTGAADLAKDLALARKADSLYGLDRGAAGDIYLWDAILGDRWNAVTSVTGPTGNAVRATGDTTHLYWIAGTNEVWKWQSGAAATQIDSGGMTAPVAIVELGPYVYVLDSQDGADNGVWEIAKSGATETQILDLSENQARNAQDTAPTLTVSANRIYLLHLASDADTRIWEITPTTAAGTGFGKEIARFPGFRGYTIWTHSGIIYALGTEQDTGDPVVVYIDPKGSIGTLGKLRQGDSIDMEGRSAAGGIGGNRLLDHHFALGDDGQADPTVPGIWRVDSVTGGMAQIASAADTDATGVSWGSEIVLFENDIFISAPSRTLRAREDQYTKSGHAISPWHDFGLADSKILSSVVLSMEDLPADWQVRVDYAIDGADTWTNVIDNSTTNSNGETAFVTTDSSTITFGSIAIRIRLDYTGVGVPTTTPVILGIDVRAQVVKKVKRWRLLLDVSDSHEQSTQTKGYQKIDNIESAGDGETAVAFIDGYHDPRPNKSTEYDVFVDRYELNLKRPGAGEAVVDLIEVA